MSLNKNTLISKSAPDSQFIFKSCKLMYFNKVSEGLFIFVYN